MSIMSRLGALCAAFAMAAACATAGAQICPASNAVAQDDIGDGCSTTYDGVDTSWFIASVGIFKGTFTSACDHHDKCYTTLGTTYSECNNALLSEMRSACYGNYNPLLLPGVYQDCMATAQTYYLGVQGLAAARDPLRVYQRDALARSVAMYAGYPYQNVAMQNVSARPSTCGTTPELTTLYDPSLISQIDSQFQAVAHRLPTIYEFMQLFLGPDFVSDRTSWNAALTQGAVTASLNPAPPIPAYTSTTTATAVVLTASSDKPGMTYVWKLTGGLTTASGNVATVRLKNPAYDTAWAISGFVEVDDPANPYQLSGRNMLVVKQMVYERGWCDDKDHHTTHCPRQGEL